MSHELPKKVKIFADTAESCARMSKMLERVQDILDRVGEDVANAQADGKSGWVHLSAAIGALRTLMRPDPDTVPFHTEIDYYLDHEPHLRWDAAGEYRTPNPALDFVLANPPMVDIQPADEPIDPKAPKLVRGEARHMSIPEASGILMELARKRSMSIDQVNALEMAVRRLMCRHFQRQRNWAKRRAARRAEDGSPHPVPEVSEVPEAPEVSEVPANPGEESAL